MKAVLGTQGAMWGLNVRRLSRAGVWPVLNGSHSLSAKDMKDEVKQAERAQSQPGRKLEVKSSQVIYKKYFPAKV